MLELDDVSVKNVLVQRMIAEQTPFTREVYLKLRYGDDLPKPWTYADEKLLPPVFRDPNTEAIQEALQGLGSAIGVTYTGEIPR
jgi:hypothetical protein